MYRKIPRKRPCPYKRPLLTFSKFENLGKYTSSAHILGSPGGRRGGGPPGSPRRPRSLRALCPSRYCSIVWFAQCEGSNNRTNGSVDNSRGTMNTPNQKASSSQTFVKYILINASCFPIAAGHSVGKQPAQGALLHHLQKD